MRFKAVRSLNHLIITITQMILLPIMLVSCTKFSEEPEHKVKEDYFDKKVKCASYIEKVKSEIDKETEDYNGYMRRDGYSKYLYLEKICFSRTYNTCVAFTKESVYKKIKGKTDTVSEVFEGKDLLTSESLGSVAKNIFDHDHAAAQKKFSADQDQMLSKIACVE